MNTQKFYTKFYVLYTKKDIKITSQVILLVINASI